MSQLVKVEIVGILPTLFSNRCTSYCNPTGVAGVKTFDAQLSEYPEDVKRDQSRAADLYDRLFNEFPGRVLVSVVRPTSIRGLWLSMKHRLSNGLWLIINGKTALDAYADYGTIKEAVSRESDVQLMA